MPKSAIYEQDRTFGFCVIHNVHNVRGTHSVWSTIWTYKCSCANCALCLSVATVRTRCLPDCYATAEWRNRLVTWARLPWHKCINQTIVASVTCVLHGMLASWSLSGKLLLYAEVQDHQVVIGFIQFTHELCNLIPPWEHQQMQCLHSFDVATLFFLTTASGLAETAIDRFS